MSPLFIFTNITFFSQKQTIRYSLFKQKRTFNDKIIEILKTKYCKNYKGEIRGAGIKFLP